MVKNMKNNTNLEEKNLYKTAERKLIYIQTANNESGKWNVYNGTKKIGETSIDDFEIDNRPNSEDLRRFAEQRIGKYMTTAGVPYTLEWVELAYSKKYKRWFRDYDVHEVLKRSGIKHPKDISGNEWFQTDLETAKKAIVAVKEGYHSIEIKTEDTPQIKLRQEQKEAVEKTKKIFKKHDSMLWNAKMRFGKTLTALQLIKECKYKRVLLMTHRPVVSDGWFDDFKKIGLSENGYRCSSRDKGETLEVLTKGNKPFIYFASIQDLRGSEIFGGKVSAKNELIAEINWDLVIIDEAHEGTQTELAQKVIAGIKKKDTKFLELSGTPFNLLDKYEKEQVYTWDYVMEQKAKKYWAENYPEKTNPYEGLPKVNMFTFDISEDFKRVNFQDIYDKSFNFNEFFRTNDTGNFVYENDIIKFLDNITTQNEKTKYPFSTEQFRNQLRHTLWIMPSRKSAKALKSLMDKHKVFGKEYTVINVVDENDDINKNEDDLQRVRKAIGDDPSTTRTITLTVRKLTTGVNIKQWTGVVFLSNTNSAMQYLQAAFRAQTPYSDEKMGMKTNCYIFDFAPDRALTVMAEASQLNTGVGKRTTAEQKEKMQELLNFLPIIGQEGNQMKTFNVDTLLTKIKRVYAEKAVRNGFDDDSLYNDELLLLDDVDLNEFNNLKAIVGTTKAEKKPLKIKINEQGLTNEEYDLANKSEKKSKKERTPQEQEALDKIKALKEQRKKMISILRSISIRIPMLIYGMDVKITEDISIKKFISLVDDISWEEFMPKGVTKELFKHFIKYYDSDVFLEAGRIIRRRVKQLDDLDPLERIEEIAFIFSTFRNPDKETVLTPWKVVNFHISNTLGGLSFYDENYQYTTNEGISSIHWIDTDYTENILNKNAHILEINSKTGLYPLYVTASLYFREFNKMNEDTAGKFTPEDQILIWKRILRENIFVIAKTPMAKAITQRTLAGYRDFDTNVEFIENLIDKAQTNSKDIIKTIKGVFDNMKFDVVIGNPPYQDKTKGDNDSFAPPVYHSFMDLSYKLADTVTLITPARFLFNAGSTPKAWNEKMLKDEHLKIVKYEPISGNIFPKTDIKGGVVITLRDKNKNFKSLDEKYAPAGIFIPFNELTSIMHKVVNKNFQSFSDIIYSRTAYKLTKKLHEDYPNAINKLSKGHAFDMSSNIFHLLPKVFFEEEPNDEYNYVKILGRDKNKRVYKYIRQEYVYNQYNLDKYKVFVPQANGSGTLGEVISSPTIGFPNIGSTETFISIGAFDDIFEAKATLNFIKTKFVRTILGILKITQNGNKEVWKLVPMQDFTINSDIDWSKSIHEIDLQLYKKYNLSDKEINFIETKVQAME